MKFRFSAICFLGSAVLFFGLDQASLQAGDSPLEKSMEKMQDAKKELYPALKAPVAADKDRYVALAKVLKSEAETARNLVPDVVEKMPAEQKNPALAEYQKQMDEFIKTAQSLVEALEGQQWDQAKIIVAKMKDEEKAGHKAFRPKKEKPAAGPA